MRQLRWIVWCVLIATTILLISPFFIGLYIQHHYHAILKLYPSTEVELEQYKRGWFHSTATIIVHVNDLQGKNKTLPIPSQLTIDQTILHGPLIYRSLKDSSFFEIAAIVNHLRPSHKINLFFKTIGAPLESFRHHSFVSFTGNISHYFALSLIDYRDPVYRRQIKIGKSELTLAASLAKKRELSGQLYLQTIFVEDGENTFLIPSINLYFKEKQPLWLTDYALHFPEIVWLQSDKEVLSLFGLHFDGSADSIDGAVNGTRKVDIRKIFMADRSAGPLHLKISVNHLNGLAISDLITAYSTILQRGELYQSQLQKKMVAMFPAIIQPGSSLSLDTLNIEMPNGKLLMDGQLVWKLNGSTLPDNVEELFASAYTKMHLSISKMLVNEWMDFVSQFSLQIENIPENQTLRLDNFYALQKNRFMIRSFVDQSLLSENTAQILLTLQNNKTSLIDYNQTLKTLFLEKKISLALSYYLFLLYEETQKPLEELDSLIQKTQHAIKAGMQEQLNEWIKKGYIKEEKEDYIVSIDMNPA